MKLLTAFSLMSQPSEIENVFWMPWVSFWYFGKLRMYCRILSKILPVSRRLLCLHLLLCIAYGGRDRLPTLNPIPSIGCIERGVLAWIWWLLGSAIILALFSCPKAFLAVLSSSDASTYWPQQSLNSVGSPILFSSKKNTVSLCQALHPLCLLWKIMFSLSMSSLHCQQEMRWCTLGLCIYYEI